ncbi:serine/threonine protein kinase [Metamycoplasma cloacale]|uniref:Serine/threonine protein kinase n=1 Tax=Metamycoplasma cloacale TaxID=92401 RepID=A0A2Z4LLL8_9BACT|nr:serine/threonine-protein kinase [Metamycoplasma cloacale]AWX42606.1 serine/threonine protein kinase [Metamycoplasma cloacale]VEU79652.1 serine/threonine protein kinase [Metamycoplasma cloacale]
MNLSKYKNLNKNFHDFKLIGEGGFGEVYSAIFNGRQDRWAIKVLTNSDSANKHINRSRFKNEVNLLKEIDSINVVKFYGHYLSEDECYLAMELVNGHSLKELLNKNQQLNAEQTVAIAKQICQGLIDIHQHNIVHRDLKPSNILINENQIVKLIDFGISLSDETIRLTTAGKVVGSIYYMAPELILGKASPSPQSDIYALGILMYEMLKGKVPFSGSDFEVIANCHVNQKLPSLKEVNHSIPQALENIILKCTAKKPSDRYTDCVELYQDLQTCLTLKRVSEEKIQIGEQNSVQKAKKFFHSKKFAIILGTIGGLLIIILIILIALSAKGVI